jgi:phosphoglycerate dehydrogenase-like enzyme
MAMLLQLTRNLRYYAERQKTGEWRDEGETPWPSSALAGRTMLVVGLGGIGTEIAQRAHGFGMKVIATRRSDSPSPEFVERVGKPDELAAMLPEADVVAIAVPLTAETDGLFNDQLFNAMKPGAILINIARGRIVNTDALVAALTSGRLAGACLDVTDPEPLPSDHGLWKMPQVVITPHIAADADLTSDRRRVLVRENIRRFSACEPLLNVVDKKVGY